VLLDQVPDLRAIHDPDAATAALGILVAAGVLETAEAWQANGSHRRGL